MNEERRRIQAILGVRDTLRVHIFASRELDEEARELAAFIS
jgi:hypothetical protein